MGYPNILDDANNLLHRALHQAVSQSQQAGDQALSRAAHQNSIHFYNYALNSIKNLPPAQISATQIIDINLQIIQPYIIQGQLDMAEDLLAETLQMATDIQDTGRIIETTLLALLFHWIKGDYPRCIQISEHLLRQYPVPENQQITLSARIAGVYFDRGQFRKAEQINQKNIGLLKKSNSLKTKLGLLTIASIQPYMHSSQIAAFRGKFDLAYQYARNAQQVSAECNHPFSQAYVDARLGSIYVRQGLFSTALFYLENNQRFCIFSQNQLFGPYVAMIPFVKAQLGNIQEGLDEFHRCFQPESLNQIQKNYISQIFGWYAETLLLAGQYKQALQACQKALTNANQLEERSNQAWLCCLKAEILLHLPNPLQQEEKITHLLSESLQLCENEGMRPQQAHGYVVLGKLYHLQGEFKKTEQFFARAYGLYVEMGMFFYCYKLSTYCQNHPQLAVILKKPPLTTP